MTIDANSIAGRVIPTTTIGGSEYPQITPDLRVIFRINAPEAQKVEFDLGKHYLASKDADGYWTAITEPQVPGFHYYFLKIDGVAVNDPNSETFYGCGRQTSGIEIPETDVNFYLPQDVPQGEIRERRYFSKTTGSWRRIYIYTPAGYDADRETHYPVLYLQHGGGEDERGWGNQGRAGIIMDNLIAGAKTEPMLVVMEKGYALRPGEAPVPLTPGGGRRDFKQMFSALDEVFVNDLIPLIDSQYRTIPDREHRAIAGLSMGGLQAFTIGLGHLDMFASIGGFSGAGGGFGSPVDLEVDYSGVMADPEAFNSKMAVLWIGIGTAEGERFYDSIHSYHKHLEAGEIKHYYYESPGTAHEWLTWRRCLHEFAPLLFHKQNEAPVSLGDSKSRTAVASSAVTINPDDIQLYPEPPAGIDSDLSDIPHGKLEMIEYYSKTVGTQRLMNVYTPPGYSSNKKYPVLYLLHGIGGDETEWERFAKPSLLMDNLLAEKKTVPMIIVMPNGRAQKDDRAVGNVFASAPAFAVFEQDLILDVIPAIEARYSVLADRDHRALAGLSMGGGQALDFGLLHIELFAWIGAFSPAPNTYPPAQLVPDPQAVKDQLRLLWLSCGAADGLFHISQGVHLYLKQHGVSHIWNVSSYGHDIVEWQNNLYHFLQSTFQ